MTRRLLPFLAVLVVYVALGIWLKSVVLNWIVGPLFLLIALELVPRALGRKPLFQLPPPSSTEEPAAP